MIHAVTMFPELFHNQNATSAGSGADEKFGDAMDVNRMLADLRQERQQIEEAILSLERLARGRGRRRGRPPAWLTQIEAPKRRGRPPGSRNKTGGGSPKTAAVA